MCPLMRVGGVVFSIDFAPCGTKLAATCNIFNDDSISVQIFSKEGSTGNFVCQSTLNAHSDYVRAVAWSPCGQWLASGGDDRMIFIYDANTFEVKSSLRGHGDAVSSLAFRPDDPNVLVTGSWDKTVKLWDLSTSTCLSTMRGHTDRVWSVCFSSDGKQLTSGSRDKTVRNWDLATRASLS